MRRSELQPSPYTGTETKEAEKGVELHDRVMETIGRKTEIEKQKEILETREILSKIDLLEAQIASTRAQSKFIGENKLVGPASGYQSAEGLNELADKWQEELNTFTSSVEWSVHSHKFGKGGEERNLVTYTPARAGHALGTRWTAHGEWIKTWNTPKTLENAKKGAEDVATRFRDFHKMQNVEVRRMTLPDFDETYKE